MGFSSYNYHAGSIVTKGVIIDEYNNIITSACLYTEGDSIKTVKRVIKTMQNDIDLDKYGVVSIGTTGSARKLIGLMLGASSIQNEINAEATGTIKMYPDVRTILEIGGQDSKIILVNNGRIVDYAISSSCMTGTGTCIEMLAQRLGVNVKDISEIASESEKMIDITSRCAVFLETDIINKLQLGYNKEDILAGVCHAVAVNYYNNIIKGKKIRAPIVFNGGVSKNEMVVKYLEEIFGVKIIVDKNSHLMGALGVAIMARESKKESVFDFNINECNVETKITNCNGCANNCEIVNVYKSNQIVDKWGNRCNQVVSTSLTLDSV